VAQTGRVSAARDCFESWSTTLGLDSVVAGFSLVKTSDFHRDKWSIVVKLNFISTTLINWNWAHLIAEKFLSILIRALVSWILEVGVTSSFVFAANSDRLVVSAADIGGAKDGSLSTVDESSPDAVATILDIIDAQNLLVLVVPPVLRPFWLKNLIPVIAHVVVVEIVLIGHHVKVTVVNIPIVVVLPKIACIIVMEKNSLILAEIIIEDVSLGKEGS